jgi:hypothetical protein
MVSKKSPGGSWMIKKVITDTIKSSGIIARKRRIMKASIGGTPL